MADSAHPYPSPDPDRSGDEAGLRADVKASLIKMAIALARQAAYEDHIAAMQQRKGQ